MININYFNITIIYQKLVCLINRKVFSLEMFENMFVPVFSLCTQYTYTVTKIFKTNKISPYLSGGHILCLFVVSLF